MAIEEVQHELARAFVHRLIGGISTDVVIRARPLRGGLESDAVVEVTAVCRDAGYRRRSVSFVMKRLPGDARREASIYERFAVQDAAAIMPQLLGIRRERGAVVLLLER